MALKSKEWFYKQCLHEVKNWSPLAHLAWDILEKGIGQRDQTRGHVTQAIGAAQKFLGTTRSTFKRFVMQIGRSPFGFQPIRRLRTDGELGLVANAGLMVDAPSDTTTVHFGGTYLQTSVARAGAAEGAPTS